MSESENVKRVLSQAAELASARIDVQDNDIRQLNYQLSQERKKTKKLEDACYSETLERLSQEMKADASLLFMFLFGCMAAVAIAYTILKCQ
jgi:hypothetical protein